MVNRDGLLEDAKTEKGKLTAKSRNFRASTDQGAKAGMSLVGIRKIEAAFPSRTEQRAIAATLSDVDALLAKLDQLIAQKRDLKQAAMIG